MSIDGLRGDFIIGVISRALSYIDPRLVGHGERVAFLCIKMLETGGKTDCLDRYTALLLALLHDVGAYKTEDIDKMLEFETKDVNRHAVYGYLFLQSRSFLTYESEAILYHHTPYTCLNDIRADNACAAALIHLCDRVDILVASGDSNPIIEIQKRSGSLFDPELVKQFARCEERFNTSSKIIDGSWTEEFEEIKKQTYVSREDVIVLMRMLIYAIDFRSEQTVTHTTGVVAYTEELARIYGITGDALDEILLAAFLHDIGKIATPVEILEKPGRLTDDEMGKMRKHIDYTEDILRGMVPDSVVEIAVRHHEKPNGMGYPRGLSGGELTKEQRIVAVADVLSALIQRRSYKEPFTKEQTLEIIKKMSDNNELSPDICNTVCLNFDEISHCAAEKMAPATSLYEHIKKSYHELLSELESKNKTVHIYS